MVWSIENIPDQSSKVIFITGATSGIGLESARVLASRGAHLVLACRNKEKMANVAKELRIAGAKQVDELVCDTSDLKSVRACAESYNGPPIDVLLLNAGIGHDAKPSAQGYERVFATNHLGHWLLTGLLLNKVKGRIVVVSSKAHTMQNSINWSEVVVDEKSKKKTNMYGPSKLANLLFVEELNRRFKEVGSNVVAVGCHPGLANTDIAKKIENGGMVTFIIKFTLFCLGQSGKNGAWPLLMAATDDKINSDCYYAPRKGLMVKESRGPPISNGKKSDAVTNVQLGKELWEESEKLCDFKYHF